MAKATASGITVSRNDLPLIFGMIARGDRRHDVAAWFGLNQGRIKEVEDGAYGTAAPAAENRLPPSGSPGPKARELRRSIEEVYQLLRQIPQGAEAAIARLERARAEYDRNE